jgi:serine/threonine protein kinase
MTTAEFIALVRKSGVVDNSALDEFFGTTQESDDPRECANDLVRAKVLTQFQAKNLLNGKYRGLVLGTYKLLQPLGQGGMGVVYLAEHTLIKRKVAIKVLPHGQALDQLNLDRFYREARAAAALDHPNIVRLYDVGQGGGVHFLAMEYVDGVNLQTLVERTGPLHFTQAVEYVAQAAAGLQHAHDKGFVHRDVKPANLMREKSGIVKILDMGLARSVIDPKDDLTSNEASQAITGTADFLAPEQALSQPVDARSDIYSLGMTLFSLVTGQPPFQGTTAQKLLQHQMKKLPPLSQLRATVPPRLSEVVAKMTAKRAADRYQSASEVIDALRPWLPAAMPLPNTVAGNPLSASDHITAAETVRDTKVRSKKKTQKRLEAEAARQRKKKIAIIAGSALGLVLVVGGLLAAFSGSKKPDRDTAQDITPNAPPSATPTGGTPPGRTSQPPKLPAVTPKQSVRPVRSEGPFIMLPVGQVATATTARPLFYDREGETLDLDSWQSVTVKDVPFQLIDPKNGEVSNIILLNSTMGVQSSSAPTHVSLAVNARAQSIHFLGMVGGWCWPFRPQNGENLRGQVVMIVRLKYDDGQTEDHPLRNGEHIADYIRVADVPGSELAFTSPTGRQVRYLGIVPRRSAVINQIQLVKGEMDVAAPIVMAVTVQTRSGKN